MPIILEGELIGVQAVSRNQAGNFSAEKTNLVLAFADQAAVAIANARLTIEASAVGDLHLKGFGRPISTYQVHGLPSD